MSIGIGISGFGRIGRHVLRAMEQSYGDQLQVVAINDLADPWMLTHLLKYDTISGKFDGSAEAGGDRMVVNGRTIKVLGIPSPHEIPWAQYGASIVVESSGRFTDASQAAGHLTGGAKKVIISAPARGEDLTVMVGINDSVYDPAKHHVVSASSCTTSCAAPVAKVLNDRFGIVRGLLGTVHAYSGDQRIIDQVHRDPRRARAAAANIVPTTTGAAKAIARLIPELEGAFGGMAVRVPVTDVSLIDFVVQTACVVTAEEVNDAFRAAAARTLSRIMAVSEEPLVSSDYRGNPFSCIIDALSTMVVGGELVKVLAWYDNEWSFSMRIADLCTMMARRGLDHV